MGTAKEEEGSDVAELESATRSNLKLRETHKEIVCNKQKFQNLPYALDALSTINQTPREKFTRTRWGKRKTGNTYNTLYHVVPDRNARLANYAVGGSCEKCE